MKNKLPFNDLPAQTIDTDSVSIALYPIQSLLILVWKRQINLEERIAGFKQGLVLTKQYQIKNWLIDDLHLYYISPAEKAWVLSDWIDAAVQSSILKMAVVCSEYYHTLMANIEFTSQGQKQYQSKGIIGHEVFPDYSSALIWLLTDNIP